MARWLLNTLAVLSLGVFFAAVAVWARSYFASHDIRWEYPRGGTTARASRGQYWLYRFTSLSDQSQQNGGSMRHDVSAPSPVRYGRDPWVERYWHSPVLTYRAGASPAVGMAYWDVIVPCWVPAALAVPLPGYAFLRERKRRRRLRRAKAGRCFQCGYDLRATPGRCPECGAEGARAA